MAAMLQASRRICSRVHVAHTACAPMACSFEAGQAVRSVATAAVVPRTCSPVAARAATCGVQTTTFSGQVRGFALWGSNKEATAEEPKEAAAEDASPGYTVVDAEYEDVGALEGDSTLADNRPVTAWFTKRNIKGSTKKLNLLARQIRGLSVNEAIAQMAFSPKFRGGMARHVVERAISNADFYHGWERDDLCIEEAFVGKNAQYPRIRYHSRGRAGTAHLRYSQMTVHVRPMTPEERSAKSKNWAEYDSSRAANPRQY